MADLRVSTTDPDASPMHQKKKGASRLGYQTHYVVDGGKARVVLDVLVAPAEVNESLPMLELLFRNRFRWRLRACADRLATFHTCRFSERLNGLLITR